MDNTLKSIIDESNSVLILLPTRPYFDQVAAGLSLYLALRDKKDVQIYSPASMTVEFNHLVGVNKITQDLGNKNLVIQFVDYKANDIERVSYDVEDGQFRLAVIPKPKLPPPSKDQIQLSYSGVSADTVILVGGTNASHFPSLDSKDIVGAKLVHIGNKEFSLGGNKKFVSMSKQASSVSEVVAILLKDSGIYLDEDSATNLLMGMENATNNFGDPSVNAETFQLAADLMRAGGRRTGRDTGQTREYPPGSIPGQTPRKGFQHQDVRRAKSEQSEEENETPKEWLEPKIFKGTSVS